MLDFLDRGPETEEGGEGWSEEADPEVVQLFQDIKMDRLRKAEEEQALAARLGRERYFLEHGQVTAMIHPEFYHYWGQRLGYECWDDDEFPKEFLRDNPVCRVISRPRNVTMGYSAALNYARRKLERKMNGVVISTQEDEFRGRFRKVYGEVGT